MTHLIFPMFNHRSLRQAFAHPVELSHTHTRPQ